MKNLIEIIKESIINESVFVAIEDIAEPDHYHPKKRTSYRVVTLDTFKKLVDPDSDNRRSYGEHHYYELGRGSSREEAESFLPSSEKKPRKSSINKEGADYIVYTIPLGKVSPTTGKTKFDWSVFDEDHKDSELYLISHSGKANWCSVLWGSKDSLKVGDKVVIVDNDSQRKTSGVASGVQIVFDSCTSTQSDFDKIARKYDSFRGRGNKKWDSLGTWYSIKGVTN